MHFVKCIASKPGVLENITFDFSDKVNVVYGNNGAGKTLLAKALLETLWSRLTTRRLLKEGTWDSLYLELICSLGPLSQYKFRNNRYKYFTIHYMNNFDEKIIYSENLGETSGDEAVPQFLQLEKLRENKALHSFLQRVDLDTMLTTSYIPSSADIDQGMYIDYPSIRQIILRDDSRYFELHRELETVLEEGSERNKLSHRMTKYEELQKELNKKMKIIDIQNSRFEKIRKEKNSIADEILALTETLESLKNQKKILLTVLEDLKKIEELNRNLENIRNEVQYEQEKIRSISQLHSEIEKLFPQFRDLGITTGPDMDGLQELFIQLRNLNEKIDEVHSRRARKKNRIQKFAVAINIASITATSSILVKNGFSYTEDIAIIAPILGFALLSTPILVLLYFLAGGKKELKAHNEEKLKLEDSLKEILGRSNIELQDYKVGEVYEFLLQYFEDYMEYTERMKDLAKLQGSVRDEASLRSIEEKLEGFRNEEETVKEKIRSHLASLSLNGDVALETSALAQLVESLDLDMEKTAAEIALKKNISEQIDIELRQTPPPADDLDAISIEKENAGMVLQKLGRNKQVLGHIVETIGEAILVREKMQLGRLAETALQLFNHITGNQYVIRMDEKIIEDFIRTGALPDGSNPTMVYALLLAVKIALTDFLLAVDMRLPLIIDDPFQFMDNERTERFRKLIQDISQKRQVLIFTHHGGKEDWGTCLAL